MLLNMIDFKGMIPKRHPRLLPPNHAQLAVDVDLSDGALRPMRAPSEVATVATSAETIYKTDEGWEVWGVPANVVPGPIASDRLYITGTGKPRLRHSGGEVDLELPAPTAAPTVVVDIAPDPEVASFTTLVFAFTWVTELDEESAPSPLTASVDWSSGNVTLDNFPPPPSGRLVDRVRIYRSLTSGVGITDLYFMGEATLAELTGPFNGVVLDDPASEPIPTAHFSTPPINMKGLTAMPNGMMAAFAGRELLFCEPYQPHAWPASYRLAVDFPIVGLVAFGSHLAILTEGTPYRAQGLHPESVALEKIEEQYPCLSPEAIVDLGYAAIYPSSEGLVQITATGAQVISREVFTREQWNAMDPTSMRAARHGNRYILAFGGNLDGHPQNAIILHLEGGTPHIVLTSIQAKAFFNDVKTGKLYFLDYSGRIFSFDDPSLGDYATYTWRSKLFDLPYDTTFSVAEVAGQQIGPSTTFAADVDADGVNIHTLTTLDGVERLPSGYLCDRWEVEVRSAEEVQSIALASSMRELGRQT